MKDPLLEAIAQINVGMSGNKNKKREMVDIITFCDSPEYLNLPANRLKLRPSQRIMLKTFYMGTRGNEKLTLSKEEWEWLYEKSKKEEIDGVVYENNLENVISKLLKKEQEKFNFRELNLVLGRRAGKTLLASLISAYEAYKLLVINNEDPHEFYGMPEDDEIAIINVALSQDQAGRLFGHIQARLRNSPFFAGRIAKETTSEIRLYTKRDLEKKAKGAVSGMSVPGSIVIVCGHSNPDTLAGRSAILILFDELAFYDESGKVTGRYFYDRLSPSLSQFFKYGDGRLVEISSPNAMNGIFHDIHVDSKKDNSILSFQLPTWTANPEFSYDHPDLVSTRKRNPERFAIEYGAQWARSGTYGNYFDVGLIERCMRTDLCPHLRPQPGFNYHIHVDPAKSGTRYVAVMVAKERYTNHLGKRRVRVRLANVWVWNPEPGVGLLFSEIDRQMVEICGAFRPMTVSYDQYNSQQSMELLRSHGVHVIETSFNRGFKNRIYQNLKDMMSYYPVSELWLYDEPRLLLEMKCLKYRPTMRGISLVVDKQGDIQTDDVCDCLAGATAMASEHLRPSLPETVVAWTGMR